MVKKSPLSEATERALLQHLSSPNRYNKFAQLCKSHPLLWSKDPKLQKAISNRKSYLDTLSGPQFLKLCMDQGVSTSTQKTFEREEDYEEDYEEEDSSDSSEESDLLRSPQVKRSPQIKQSPQVQQPSQVQPSPQIKRTPQVQRSPQVQPPLEIMSSSSRRGVLPAIYGHEEEYELNFQYPERNPPGLFAFMTPNVMLESKEMVDVVSVYKCMVDARDLLVTTAEMLEDGTGILVSQPSLPSFLIKEVKQIHESEKKEFFCESLMRDHLVMANAIDKRKERQPQEVELKFPPGITCNTKHFKNKAADNRLKNNMRLCKTTVIPGATKTDAPDQTQEIPYILWRMTVDKEDRHVEFAADSDSDDDLIAMYKRTSKIVL